MEEFVFLTEVISSVPTKINHAKSNSTAIEYIKEQPTKAQNNIKYNLIKTSPNGEKNGNCKGKGNLCVYYDASDS